MNDVPRKIEVTFLPAGVTVEAPEGDSLFEIAGAHKVPIATRCKGEARCGCCLVEVIDGGENLNKIRIDERDYLPREEYRLACRARVFGPVRVRRVLEP